MYKELFHKVVNASKNNSLTFFVGAGISKLSNAPKWSELIDAFCEQLGIAKKDSYSNEEYLSIPQMFYYSIEQDTSEYYNFVNSCFGEKDLLTNEIHKFLFDFNPHAFVTTNFDDLLEKAAVENCQAFKTVACDTEISQINGDRFILKLHGDLKHKNIVLKEEDYLNYSENFKLMETLLKSIFATNTVVFIGYGLNDYNIKLILNWTKSLLKDNFVKPIFIYTDDKELSKEELKYHESKGLNVVDFRKFSDKNPQSIDYLKRYELVLNAIKKTSDMSLNNVSKQQAFEILYSHLEPLNKLKALKIEDIKKTLEYKVIIDERGLIDDSIGENILLEYFVEILCMTDTDKETLPKDVLLKHKVICNIFLKARISCIVVKDHKRVAITGETYSFADPYCIKLDYCAMLKYVENNYANTHANYKKAYYLAKLNRYREAYDLFVEVSIAAFKEEDYLLFFMAQANRKYLFSSMKSINRTLLFYNTYDTENINGGLLNEEQMDHLFEKLPLDVQKQYSCFKDLASINSLYEISYNSFIDGKKLQNSIETNTLEIGITSDERVFSRINSYLHFFLGNCLFMDEFVEFKKTISNLMSLEVYKYSVQEKKNLNKDLMFGFPKNKIYFDEIDFYCFITYFDGKELEGLFYKHGLNTIEFHNIDIIGQAILNIIKYYDEVLSKSKQFVEVSACQQKLKTCIALLGYMNISQELVDTICEFLFKYEFRDIDISDKIVFLNSQVWKRKKYSDVTAKVIENKLIFYIDQHLKALKNNNSFELYSRRSNLSYHNLVHYISPDDTYISKRLSIRVSKIVKDSYNQLKRAVEDDYYAYISTYQKKKFVNWVKVELNKKFDFNDIQFFVGNDIKIDKNNISSLKKHLKETIKKAEGKSRMKCSTFPSNDVYEDLDDVGYYCFIGLLNKKDFRHFLGVSKKFDFFYKYNSFNFDEFEISWLLEWTPHVLKAVGKNRKVKEKIRALISKELLSSELNDSESKRLTKMLVQYFC